MGLIVGLERKKESFVLWGWELRLLGVADKACEEIEV